MTHFATQADVREFFSLEPNEDPPQGAITAAVEIVNSGDPWVEPNTGAILRMADDQLEVTVDDEVMTVAKEAVVLFVACSVWG